MMAPTTPTPDRPGEAARRALSVIFLINGALFATWAVNIPGVRDALNLSEAQIGAALLAVGLGSLCSMTLTGGWTARHRLHRRAGGPPRRAESRAGRRPADHAARRARLRADPPVTVATVQAGPT